MADPFQPVRAGMEVQTSARTENGLRRAGQDYSRRRLGEPGSEPGGSSTRLPQIYNGTTAALDAFSVIAYGAAIVSPAAMPLEAADQPVFAAATPTADGLFCITKEPIPVGNIGDAVMNGPAVVKVNVTDATHTRAIAVAGVTARLNSAAGGGVPILWKETGTGLKWAEVLVGCQTAPTIYSGVTSGSTSAGSVGSVNVAGVGTVAVYNQWSTAIGDAKKCLIGWAANEGLFQFIAVDC